MLRHGTWASSRRCSVAPVAVRRAYRRAAMATAAAAQPPQTGLLHMSFEPGQDDAAVLRAAAVRVTQRLYVSLDGEWAGGLDHCNKRLAQIYSALPGTVDARVLLPAAWGADGPPACLAPELQVLIGSPNQEALLAPLNSARAASGLCGAISFVGLELGEAEPSGAAKRHKVDAKANAAGPAPAIGWGGSPCGPQRRAGPPCCAWAAAASPGRRPCWPATSWTRTGRTGRRARAL